MLKSQVKFQKMFNSTKFISNFAQQKQNRFNFNSYFILKNLPHERKFFKRTYYHGNVSPKFDFPNNKMSVLFELVDGIGKLETALKQFRVNDVNLSRIESRPSFCCDKKKFSHKTSQRKFPTTSFKFFVDFDIPDTQKNLKNSFDENSTKCKIEKRRIDKLVNDLKNICSDVQITGSKEVPQFPYSFDHIASLAHNIIGSDTGDLEADHPGFNDTVYRKRRGEIAKLAQKYQIGEPIPRIKYTKTEIKCWSNIYSKLTPLQKKFACKEFLEVQPEIQKNCGYGEESIPQLADVSDYVQEQTGFILCPVAGLLSARDFLAGLAFRIFFCTQYIRHESRPFYTPEPDIVHEIMGHAPMFAVKEFADFSQQIGLLSIGSNNEQIERLARCYWYSVEFGVVRQNNSHKAYGAGLLSSVGEIEYMVIGKEPKFRDQDPTLAAKEPYPITKYQPLYYVANSFADALDKLRQFAETLDKPFNVQWNPKTKCLDVDRNISMQPKDSEKCV